MRSACVSTNQYARLSPKPSPVCISSQQTASHVLRFASSGTPASMVSQIICFFSLMGECRCCFNGQRSAAWRRPRAFAKPDDDRVLAGSFILYSVTSVSAKPNAVPSASVFDSHGTGSEYGAAATISSGVACPSGTNQACGKFGLRLSRIGQSRAGAMIDANMPAPALQVSVSVVAGFRHGIAGEIRGQPVNALVSDNIGVFDATGLQFRLIGKVVASVPVHANGVRVSQLLAQRAPWSLKGGTLMSGQRASAATASGIVFRPLPHRANRLAGQWLCHLYLELSRPALRPHF